MSNPSEQEPSNSGDMLCVTVADGKYTVRQDASGRLTALRHGESWRDCVGDGLVHALACEVDKLQGLLKRCLPIVHNDACMMADITRHAPLDAASQAEHDSTEFESERLMRDIPTALGLHTREALKAVLAAPRQPPADVPERPQPPPTTSSPMWMKLRKLDAKLDQFIRIQDSGAKSPLAVAMAASLRGVITGFLEVERKSIGEFGEPGDIGVADALERAVANFLAKFPENLLTDGGGEELTQRVSQHLADGLDGILKDIKPGYAPDRYDYDLRKTVTDHALKDTPPTGPVADKS